MRNLRHHFGAWLALVFTASRLLSAEQAPDPRVTIPLIQTAPVIDGQLKPGEWQYAAAISMFEAYPCYVDKVVRQEQPVFYVCWDRENLYVAMDSRESPLNRIAARCTQADNTTIIGDDCMEFMVAPGAGAALSDPDFPTYYLAVNAIGTLWDAKFVPLRAESHNSWRSGADIAHSVDGTRWICEMRIPFASLGARPAPGDVWRMNFDRTYFGYWWTAWNASGGLNDARVGGDVTFADAAPAVRLVSIEPLIAGKLKLAMEVVNGSSSPGEVKISLAATGRDSLGDQAVEVGRDEKTLALKPDEVLEFDIGGGQLLRRHNTLTLTAAGKDGQSLFFVQRDVNMPVPRIARALAPDLPMVYVFPRFLPSLERLAVNLDATAWLKKMGVETGDFKAEIAVYAARGAGAATNAFAEPPVVSGVFTNFVQGRGVWRHDTRKLPEGDYTVRVLVTERGKELVRHEDWFEKRIFDWMQAKWNLDESVPAPFTALTVKDASVQPSGRDYRFAPSGLPAAMISQSKPLLSGPVALQVTVDGKAAPVETVQPFKVTSAKPGAVRGVSRMQAGGLTLDIESVTEYDGFTLFRLTYGPSVAKGVNLNRMRLRVPLDGKFCRFYSASGDREGTSIQGEVLPPAQGKFYDSKTDTYAVGGMPSFATLFWTGDYGTYFCYAADNPQGWIISDDLPAVEAWREGNDVVLWLNLVDRETLLTGARTLEFAFQTGPTQPLPKGWRGIQFDGDPQAAPVTLRQIGGSGNTLFGGPCFIHPGFTPETVAKSKAHIEAQSRNGQFTILGYQRWPAAVKSHPAFRVFRGEWGIDKSAWEKGGHVSDHSWKQRLYGADKDAHTMFLVQPVSSYVDYLIHGYEAGLKETALHGIYDDTGYPISVYDEELGLGFMGDDGRQVSSSGLWTYRKRWKRASAVHAKRGLPNYTCDSQHVQAHFQPAYGFIGIWAPCERGYYNPFPDRDNLDFYGSIERYYAYNPSHAFGQIGSVGMATTQRAFNLAVRDTRCMMMLALLHDQDVGSFGHRDLRTVCRLREARNVFRQWEDDVSFTGYWEPDGPVRVSNKDFRVSLYRRPGRALLMIGNVGEAGQARITLDWKKLGIEPASATVGNPETGVAMPLRDGGFDLALPRHDLALILAGDLAGCAWQPAGPGNPLPRPATILAELSDPLRGPALDPAWTVDTHTGISGAGFVDGRCYVQASHYGYGHIRRKLGVDNVTVQCMLLGTGTGQADAFSGGLGLWWDSGAYVRVIPGGNQKSFHYEVSGARPATGRPVNTNAAPRWYPFCANGVRIRLTPDTIRFLVSTDGVAWEPDREVARAPEMAGAPAWAIVGNGGATGREPFFKNVHPQHFAPDRGDRITVVTDFVVGHE